LTSIIVNNSNIMTREKILNSTTKNKIKLAISKKKREIFFLLNNLM
jgi:hypothetical protein